MDPERAKPMGFSWKPKKIPMELFGNNENKKAIGGPSKMLSRSWK